MVFQIRIDTIQALFLKSLTYMRIVLYDLNHIVYIGRVKHIFTASQAVCAYPQ